MNIIGAGLAGSEAALQLARRGFRVTLFEMRPKVQTPVHESGRFAELVCSNSLKSMKPESAAGMLKAELDALGSCLLQAAHRHAVAAGGALAVDRVAFADDVTGMLRSCDAIEIVTSEVTSVCDDGDVMVATDSDTVRAGYPADAVIIASGPMTSELLAHDVQRMTGRRHLAFYDAAAPVVLADSLDTSKLFRQSRYEDDGLGDYLNAPFSKEEYDSFIDELVRADRVIRKDFETKDLFQACQPIEEIARKGADAPRFGTLKPVGLRDPRTSKRPWAALQLRAEDAFGQSYNLVGFQTNLTFPEQRRVFRMIPGLEHAEFSRYGVMHRNTFVDAPRTIDVHLRMKGIPYPVYLAGQVSGTEGYCEAIMSGLYAAIAVSAQLSGVQLKPPPTSSAFGSLLAYATDSSTQDYQPMHVNFGIIEPLTDRVKNKQKRYAAYATRGERAMSGYRCYLEQVGLIKGDR